MRLSKREMNQLTAGIALIVAFFVVSALVTFKTTQILDLRLALALNRAAFGDTFTAVIVFFSKYGREYFWISIVGIMVIFGKRETRVLGLELVALFVIGIFVGEALKSVMYRPRPFEVLSDIITRVPVDMNSSYPSGHAVIVSIGAFFSLIKLKRRLLALLLTLEAVVVCYSRVYVGMHYPLDVVAGVFIGVAIVLVGTPILERTLRRILDRLVYLFTRTVGEGVVML